MASSAPQRTDDATPQLALRLCYESLVLQYLQLPKQNNNNNKIKILHPSFKVHE